MLKRMYRLRKEKEINGVLRRGAFVGAKYMSIRVARSPLSLTRFSFVVGTKVSKKAVERNRVRRQLMEIVRHMLPRCARGYDVVVMTRPGILNVSYDELAATTANMFRTARLLER